MGKSILESKTVWGVVGMIGALVAAKLGYNIDADTLGGLLLDISTWAVGVVMFFWGLRGRFVAIIHPPAGHVVDTKSLLESRSAWGIVLLFLDFVSVKLGFGHVDVEGADALLSDIVTYGVAAVAGLTGIIGRVKATAKIASVLPK